MAFETQHYDTSVPNDLESARAKLVYLYLSVRGEATADEACADLELDKGTVLSIVGTLRKYGYVERSNGCYTVV